MTEPVWVISEAPARAIPKSRTRTLPAGSTITFCGLMSRWTMPCAWAKLSAARIWRVISIACATFSPRSMRALREEPSTYSIAM
jgi:hypothetical protein